MHKGLKLRNASIGSGNNILSGSATKQHSESRSSFANAASLMMGGAADSYQLKQMQTPTKGNTDFSSLKKVAGSQMIKHINKLTVGGMHLRSSSKEKPQL